MPKSSPGHEITRVLLRPIRLRGRGPKSDHRWHHLTGARLSTSSAVPILPEQCVSTLAVKPHSSISSARKFAAGDFSPTVFPLSARVPAPLFFSFAPPRFRGLPDRQAEQEKNSLLPTPCIF